MLNKGPTPSTRAMAMRIRRHLCRNPGVHSPAALSNVLRCTRGQLRRALEWLRGRGEVRSAGMGRDRGVEWVDVPRDLTAPSS